VSVEIAKENRGEEVVRGEGEEGVEGMSFGWDGVVDVEKSDGFAMDSNIKYQT